MRLFVFHWPGTVGGADTKLDHLLPLLREIGYDIMCIANAPSSLAEKNWTDYLDSLGITYGLKEDIPPGVEGETALSLCNPFFFKEGFCKYAKDRGLKVIWSSEMMWHHEKEIEAIIDRQIDKVLYVSEIQKASLKYQELFPWLPSTMTGNYIDPARFPYNKVPRKAMVLGRVSRADPYKYPEDFPIFYEEITEGLPNDVSFSVLGWSQQLDEKYSWFNWNDSARTFRFYDEKAIPVWEFLKEIDVFAYPLGHNFVESWGRSTVEAMLTGSIPIAFTGHHLDKLIEHERSGFLANDVLEWKEIIRRLYHDPIYRNRISRDASQHAKDVHCNRSYHKQLWAEALNV